MPFTHQSCNLFPTQVGNQLISFDMTICVNLPYIIWLLLLLLWPSRSPRGRKFPIRLNLVLQDASSFTKVGNRLSTTFQTHSSLQQGALSSPILFNYHLYDLIDELNQQSYKGAKLNDTTMNDLLFADDIMLVTSSPQHLQYPLNICSNWADEWKLHFCPSKSKTLTN